MNRTKQWRVWALAAVCAAMLAGSVAVADDADEGAAAAQSPVAQALSATQVMNGAVNPQAEYYIYVQSASWCGPCKKEMPELVKIYPQMQAGHVELILVGLDGTRAEAEAYLQSYSAPFPGVHYKDDALQKLPGFELARAVPHATVVHKSGRVVAKGHGSLALKWRQIVEDDQED